MRNSEEETLPEGYFTVGSLPAGKTAAECLEIAESIYEGDMQTASERYKVSLQGYITNARTTLGALVERGY